MKELEAKGYEGGVSGGDKRKEEITSAAHSKAMAVFNGVVTLGPKAFARFMQCMTNPGEPTPANKRGAALLEKLYGNKS
jgi:hypothetical protein